jgi:purine-binding chemotaxis protein CheW
MAIIRGGLLPVVHLASLLGHEDAESGGRFVTMRAGSRQIALHVDEVIGAKHIATDALSATPPLLGEAIPAHAEKIGALDGQMVAMLRTTRILPPDLWDRMLREGEG